MTIALEWNLGDLDTVLALPQTCDVALNKSCYLSEIQLSIREEAKVVFLFIVNTCIANVQLRTVYHNSLFILKDQSQLVNNNVALHLVKQA